MFQIDIYDVLLMSYPMLCVGKEEELKKPEEASRRISGGVECVNIAFSCQHSDNEREKQQIASSASTHICCCSTHRNKMLGNWKKRTRARSMTTDFMAFFSSKFCWQTSLKLDYQVFNT